MPFISINCRLNDPFLTLSRQFLISNQSNYVTIINYLNSQLQIALRDFGIDLNHSEFYLILKYKKVQFQNRKF
jgi:hypothetical protein